MFMFIEKQRLAAATCAAKSRTAMMWALALLSIASNAQIAEGVTCDRTAFVRNPDSRRSNARLSSMRRSLILRPAARRNGPPTALTSKYDGDDDRERDIDPGTPMDLDPRRPDKNMPAFMDAMLEIPDPRMLAGDLLFILIVNFLLQIANEVGDPEFWTNGGFGQPVTMPTTFLEVIVRDSKMSIAWVLGALWNRSYSSSSVADDRTAVKTALQVWVDYCSLRILLELGGSFLFTHSAINIWLLGREAWYMAIVMAFFRLVYGRVIY